MDRVAFVDSTSAPDAVVETSTLSACVDALYVYPVKSCAGARVSELRFDADGRIEGDREWIVIDARGELAWLGSHPKLALLQPKLIGDALLLLGEGQQPLRLSREPAGEVITASIWSPEHGRMVAHAARDAGAIAAQFLRELTGEELRLVKLNPSSRLSTGPNALHAVSTGSVVELNEFLAAEGRASVDTRRLRPNLVLREAQDPLPPFIEEHVMQMVWRDGDAIGEGTWRRLVHHMACERCVVPNVDPDTGHMQSGIEIAIAALSARRWPGLASRFGIYLQPPRGGALMEGTVLTMELDF